MVEEDRDLVWIRSRIQEDLLGTQQYRAKRILEIVKNQIHFPHTIGLFGSWGSGKTTLLAALEAEITNSKYKVIYFNAYKYAGFMEVIPALLYKIIKLAPGNDRVKQKELIVRIASLANKHNQAFGEWFAKIFVGLNPVELAQDVKSVVQDSKQMDLLEEYYTKVDRIQDCLSEIYSGVKDPIFVLVDELDRCDPGEALDVLKQLRILFNMRDLPFVFVVATNPDPIGLAIKHQYGLNTDRNEFEARCILEKFVDSAIDLNEQVSLGRLVERFWTSKKITAHKATFIHDLDSRMTIQPREQLSWASKNTSLQAMSSNNPLYGNLRLLEKTLDYVQYYQKYQLQLWTTWHLTILKQADPALRTIVAKSTKNLKEITENSHLSLIGELARGGLIGEDGKIVTKLENKDISPFRKYHQFFWEETKRTVAHLRSLREAGRDDSQLEANISQLESLMDDTDAMDFLCQMSLLRFNDIGEVSFHPQAQFTNLETTIVDFNRTTMDNYGWLLSRY
ncbi:MAG: P-loop NTPase fold protein [Leptolyngbyaceae cyanobacterium bins.302]|nr:P-loop NTPase fold protein [Leptolyngbyaceae cyanobacterium bins.302]